jgi:hypothetical protein
MSGPQIDDASKPTAWWNTERGAILIAVLVFSVVIDLGGWLAGQGGLFVFLREIGKAISESRIIQVGDNSFITVFVLISYTSALEITEIFGWYRFYRRTFAIAIVILCILLFVVGDFVLNQTFVSFGYQRCAAEERVGFGKFRYSRVWFARDLVNCPQPDDPGAQVE